MHDQLIYSLFHELPLPSPETIQRCSVGHGNYVYTVTCSHQKYILRLNSAPGAYTNTVHWLTELGTLGIPVPKIIRTGRWESYDFLILTYLEGQDIGLIYQTLSREEKREIAQEILHIQNQTARLPLNNLAENWMWRSFPDSLLERAEKRIRANGYFDCEKVKRLQNQMYLLLDYFDQIKPVAYLDDISSKNLLIHNGHISGIIDVDWIGVGDKLTFVALTNMALLNLEYDTQYVTFLLEEMHLDKIQQCAFVFYTLVYCVDFMGERGMQFTGKTIEVNPYIIARLNRIYDTLWQEWLVKSRQLEANKQIASALTSTPPNIPGVASP